MSLPEGLRIGEFARRVGVSATVLRAWERRYGLLHPVRSPGGFRLYTSADADRVARMRDGLERGLSAAEAARSALQAVQPAAGRFDAATERLLGAVHDYDEPAVHAILDECVAALGIEALLGEVVLPTLARVGLQWERGDLAVCQEHFASNVIRARLLGLARLWGRGSGPLAVLACAPGESHDISLVAFGLALRSHGWRILFLGADTPIDTLAQAARSTQPRLTVLVSFNPSLLEAETAAIRRLARQVPLVVSGPGASEEVARRLRVARLDGDVITAATITAESAYV